MPKPKTSIHIRMFALAAILLLAGASQSMAQQKLQFSIADFHDDLTALTAREGSPYYRVHPGTGRAYAIVKVRSNNPNDDLRQFQFDFGLVKHEVVEAVDDELWLYVAPNAKNVTISRQGYQTLRNYDLHTTIQSEHTYELRLQVAAAPVYQQILQFTIQPVGVGATVMITPSDGREEKLGDADVNGQLAKSLPLGTYTYRVLAENYHTSEGTVVLRQQNQTYKESVTLRPNFAAITLSVAADADIFVNGERKGHQQWSGNLRAGQYTVEVRQEKHKPATQVIVVEENRPQTYQLTPPTPITGTLQVTSQPLGARVVVDGQERGVTPLSVTGLIIGSHQLELHLQNHKSESQRFDIKEDDTTPIDIKLSDIARMTIKSRPAGATLTIDGRSVGQTPYAADMASGDYDIRLVKPGWHDYQRRVHLDSSSPEVTLSLNRQYQQPSAFYFQAGMQAGTMMGISATVGAYISGVNLEAGYTLGLDKSEDIFWNYTGQDDQRPHLCQYKPSAMTVRAGYGIIFGTRLRITPQVGASILQIKSDDSKTNAVSATFGARADYALASNIGIFAAPEATFAVKKGETFKLLEPVSSKIKGWDTGFNLRAGLTLFF
ncbi:MAG: PEGA domain-containing protein [Prevotella sp.]|nr:PEGA domain-containing protein [Prevotella sp.]